MLRNIIFVFCFLIVLFLLYFKNVNFDLNRFNLESTNKPETNLVETNNSEKKLANTYFRNKKLVLEVADNDVTRELGLSYRRDIGEYGGMLFTFDKPSKQTFWMKDMNFDLDIIWVNEKGVILKIDKAYASDYDPLTPEISKKFNSPEDVKYVIELPINKTDYYDLRVGDQLNINY